MLSCSQINESFNLIQTCNTSNGSKTQNRVKQWRSAYILYRPARIKQSTKIRNLQKVRLYRQIKTTLHQNKPGFFNILAHTTLCKKQRLLVDEPKNPTKEPANQQELEFFTVVMIISYYFKERTFGIWSCYGVRYVDFLCKFFYHAKCK